MKGRKYIVYLNVLSSFAVVMLHVNHVFWAFSKETYWISANVIESIFYFAVPIFFMISGANLIGYSKKYSTATYFVKRINNTVMPFLIWTVIAQLYNLYKQHQLKTLDINAIVTYLSEKLWLVVIVVMLFVLCGGVSVLKSNKQLLPTLFKVMFTLSVGVLIIGLMDKQGVTIRVIVDNIFNARYQGVYWFFISLFSIYLVIPVLELVPENARQKFFLALSAVSFIGLFLPQFIFSLIPDMYYNYDFMLPWNTYAWYVTVGYYIDRYHIDKKYRMIIYILGVGGVLSHILGTYYYSISKGEIVSLFKGYLNVPTIFYALGIFIFFKYLPERAYKGVFYKICQWISSKTFGVYLIHYFLIYIIEENLPVSQYALSYRIGGGIIIFILSVLIVASYQAVIRQVKSGLKLKRHTT